MKTTMNNIRKALMLSLAFVTLTAPAVAGGKKVSKPFKAAWTEIITVDLRPESMGMDDIGFYLPFTIEFFDARATHLGNCVGTGEGRYYVFLFGGGADRVIGKGTLVAANGDEVDLEWVIPNYNEGPESGTISIVGGSGRFEQASGEFGLDHYEETEDGDSTPGFLIITRTGWLSGTIEY
jgi:hypothetical protein